MHAGITLHVNSTFAGAEWVTANRSAAAITTHHSRRVRSFFDWRMLSEAQAGLAAPPFDRVIVKQIAETVGKVYKSCSLPQWQNY